MLTLSGGPSVVYGKLATVTVRVPGAPGRVTLSGAGRASSTVLVGGVASFTLPRTLAAKAYTLAAAYGGDESFVSASASRALTVKRATTSFKTVRIVKKPTSKKTGTAKSSTGAGVSGRV